MPRMTWDQYFMRLAHTTAERATCHKRGGAGVGCVLVRDNIVISGGYNGSTRGSAHCDDAGCLLDAKGDCVRTVHAEANAVAQAARVGARVVGAAAYVTRRPCWTCLKLLANAGVCEVWYSPDSKQGDPYPTISPITIKEGGL